MFCLPELSRFSFSNTEQQPVNQKFIRDSQNQEHCQFCRLVMAILLESIAKVISLRCLSLYNFKALVKQRTTTWSRRYVMHASYARLLPVRRNCSPPYKAKALLSMSAKLTKPTATPRSSASLIVVNPRNEVLLVHRNPQARSFGGYHVSTLS